MSRFEEVSLTFLMKISYSLSLLFLSAQVDLERALRKLQVSLAMLDLVVYSRSADSCKSAQLVTLNMGRFTSEG